VATTSPACSAGTKLASYAYTLGNAGNRTNVLELNNRNVVYGYDNDYRLTSEAITADPAGNNGTVSYTGYDNVGNRTSMTSTLSAVPGGSFSYDNNDRLSVDTYDNNGNTTSSAGITNTYDFENRMTAHGAVTIVYDGDGNRVSETAGGVTTKYLVDTLNPTGLPQVLDEKVSGSVTRTYAYGLQRVSENRLVGSTWTPSFYGYDGHGNVRFLTNTVASVTDSYDYDAFGMPIKTSGTTPNVFLYSGERSDSSIGLYHLRDRYYNQATGRFETQDSYEGDIQKPLTLHKYVYTADNPVNFVDPTGDEALISYAALTLYVAKQTARTAYIIGKCIGQAFTSEAQAFGAVESGLATSIAVPGQFIVYNFGVCDVTAARGLFRPNPIPLLLPPWLRPWIPPVPNPLLPWFPFPVPRPKPIPVPGG
jgi:RHS repeat-associated protein